MRIVPTLTWNLEGDAVEPLDERLLPLLEAIAASGSLAAAVAECGISYRAAWGLLRDYREKLGVALASLERGRGAALTPTGERLLGVRRAASQRLARILPGLVAEVGPEAVAAPAPALRLSVAASHDLALVALADALPAAAGLQLELSFMGSLHALEAFAQGRVDVAGFHVPMEGAVSADWKLYRQWLHARRDRLIRFVDREQGFILPRGNPARVKSFRDLAAQGLRFVNRQRGSGTRLVIDGMLVDAAIDAESINGYRTEEFTHGAVAATVASGGADAGFGLRAAAAEYRLAFVPLVRERYFLAMRAKARESAAIARLVAMLASPSFDRTVRALPGYHAVAAGTVEEVSALGTKAKAR